MCYALRSAAVKTNLGEKCLGARATGGLASSSPCLRLSRFVHTLIYLQLQINKVFSDSAKGKSFRASRVRRTTVNNAERRKRIFRSTAIMHFRWKYGYSSLIAGSYLTMRLGTHRIEDLLITSNRALIPHGAFLHEHYQHQLHQIIFAQYWLSVNNPLPSGASLVQWTSDTTLLFQLPQWLMSGQSGWIHGYNWTRGSGVKMSTQRCHETSRFAIDKTPKTFIWEFESHFLQPWVSLASWMICSWGLNQLGSFLLVIHPLWVHY